MHKTTLRNRIDNAVNSFFEPEPDRDRFAMTYTGHDALLISDERPFVQKADKWIWWVREVLMFGPGVFALFFSTVTYAFDFPGVATNPYAYVLAIFLTYAGAGSVWNLRNLAVPASVIAFAFGMVSISTAILGHEKASAYFWNQIYLLPLVLVIAKSVQMFVNKEPDES